MRGGRQQAEVAVRPLALHHVTVLDVRPVELISIAERINDL